MLTFRKALGLAAFLVTTIYLITHGSHSRSEGSSSSLSETGRAGSTESPSSRLSATLAPHSKDGGAASNQQVLQSPGRSLVDRLRHQFPYDPEGKFPAYIWQTWKNLPSDSAFPADLRPSEASWTELHPTFVHEVITDAVAMNLIRYLYASLPEIVEAYTALPHVVLKADFFRYLILLARGGIYTDIDTVALKPATEWIPEAVAPASMGLIVGIEADPDRPDWKDWYSRRIQFCQWTIQAKVGHPVLRSVVATITEDTLRMKRAGLLTMAKLDKSIVEFTGPALWTDAIFSYFNSPEYFQVDRSAGRNISWEDFTGMEASRKVGDVVVLPITSFSPGISTMGAKEPDDEMAFVRHDFEGTWKPESERVKPIYP